MMTGGWRITPFPPVLLFKSNVPVTPLLILFEVKESHIGPPAISTGALVERLPKNLLDRLNGFVQCMKEVNKNGQRRSRDRIS
jgi:hypothetical protein